MAEGRTARDDSLRLRLRLRRMRVRVVFGPDAGQEVEADGGSIRIGSSSGCDLVLTDPTVSRRHAEIRVTERGMLLRDFRSTNGTWMGAARLSEAVLVGVQRFRVGKTELEFCPIDEDVAIEPSEATQFEGLVGASTPMREVFSLLERVADTDLSLLVTGETGTGKELVSRAAHTRSGRKDRPLVVFDCGAAPESLIEAELFGHDKGAFTGASDGRPGVFERAHGGTVFIDELGELPIHLQPKLLRVLESREVRRLGGREPRPVDVRVVAATNRDLRLETAMGRFRSDLFYRLAVVEVPLPPLRDRLDDLELLVPHVLATAPLDHAVRGVDAEVYAVLRKWHWPGNVRELRNVVLRAIPFCEGDTVTLDALPAALREPEAAVLASQATVPVPGADQPFREARNELLDAFERAYLEDLMQRANGRIARAARIAGVDRRTLQRMLRTHGLPSTSPSGRPRSGE